MNETPPKSSSDGAWSEAQRIFLDVVELEETERERALVVACHGDGELAAKVRALLAADARGHPMLDEDVGVLAGELLDGSVPHLTNVGPFRLTGVLGRGGMGVVYRAERPDLRQTVAIKILRDAALSPMRRDRFLNEQRLLAGLVHPLVARLYDAGVLDDGTPYFVMELVEGRTLDAYCAAERLGVAERLAIFRDVCEAVGFAHGHAVIHRDLKPSNILVDADGRPKLLDFGIAKQLEGLDAGSETRTGMRLMTPAYAAPEQLTGETVGVRTDVYALGVILYELLTGTPPFALASLTPGQAERVVLEQTPRAPSDLKGEPGGEGPPPDAASLPASSWRDLDTLVRTAMHRDPARRYASVEALIRDIDHFRNKEPLEAHPDSWSYRTGAFLRRNRRSVALTAALAVGLVSIAGFYGWRLAVARDAALDEAARTRRVLAFTQELFRGWDEAAGPADTLRVITLLDRGVREAGLLDQDPAAQAETFLTLGGIFGQLGRFERADSMLDVALELRRRASPPNPRLEGEAVAALGELRVTEGRYADAEGLLREALLAQESARPADPTAIAVTMTSLGAALEGLGRYDEATDVLSDAIARLEQRSDSSAELSAALAALAATRFYAEDLDGSDSLNLRALAIDRRLHGDGHPTLADSYINLGVAEVRRGRYAEGETYFRDAVRIFESYHGPEHPETASALRLLGNDLLFQGRLADAEPLLERALRIQEASLPPLHPRLGNTLGDLAYIRLDQGEYDQAVGLYRRIVDIYRSSNGERHYFVAIALSNLANALGEGGRLDEAEAMFRDVVDRFTETRGADDPDTGIARIKLGSVLAEAGRPADAEPELLAGYDIVRARMAPTVSWLRSARRSLIEVYDALDRPDRADTFRREEAAADSAAADSATADSGG